MSRDDEEIETALVSGKRKRGGALFSGKRRFLILIIFGIVLGAVACHYLIEPFLNEDFYQKYMGCESRYSLLDEATTACCPQLNDCKNPAPSG